MVNDHDRPWSNHGRPWSDHDPVARVGVQFSVKMKICPRLLIFELSNCTLRIFRGMILAFFINCYFWIDILGFFDSDL